jgi:hypothetical protein
MHLAVSAAQAKILNSPRIPEAGRTGAKWSLHTHPGFYETNYLARAVAAHDGIPAALAADISCFHTGVDQTGETLRGSSRYVVTLPQNSLPPVNAFWSLTLYDTRQHLAPNEVHRYVISDRNRLRHNPDNSVSLYIQHDWPGEAKDSNWLPSPKDFFSLALRMYWPKSDVLSRIWRPPAVMRTN